MNLHQAEDGLQGSALGLAWIRAPSPCLSHTGLQGNGNLPVNSSTSTSLLQPSQATPGSRKANAIVSIHSSQRYPRAPPSPLPWHKVHNTNNMSCHDDFDRALTCVLGSSSQRTPSPLSSSSTSCPRSWQEEKAGAGAVISTS